MARYGLCIGINDYPGTDEDLAGCVNDAFDWSATLESRGFMVQMLLDEQATREAMRHAIANLVSNTESGDTVAITYSGHGTWVPDRTGDEADGRDEGLCPHDIKLSGPLLDDELCFLLQNHEPGVRVLLISDSCHSGSVTRSSNTVLDEGATKARYLPPEAWMAPDKLAAINCTPSNIVAGMARAGGDTLLAGCRDSEFSWDTDFNDRPNGAFTYYAHKSLRHLPDDATYEEWFRAIRDYLPTNRLPQTPQILGSNGAGQFRVFD